ncbi:ATPase-like protein [Hyphomonas oceanitis SCH89]|uniref:ATPase-like protein n=2 Tax=Hyphomonas oceanitis TaxID=81033 RepID=A0A059G893_9PROT|nr:ATPase-like protein [Hyphomonas oceanitis SCH89]
MPLAANGKEAIRSGYQKLARGYGSGILNGWADEPRNQQCNIGILLDLSNLAVVDIDTRDFNLMSWIKQELGDTRAVVETKKGFHLYYRASGLQGFHLRSRHNIDVKAGRGSYVVAPGSTRGDFEYRPADNVNLEEFLCRLADVPEPTAHEWSFLKGVKGGEVRWSNTNHGTSPPKVIRLGGTIQEGRRNDTVWYQAMRQARHCAVEHGHTQEGFNALLEQVQSISSEHCQVAQDGAEVDKITRSAWKYEIEGKNLIGSSVEAAAMARPKRVRELPSVAFDELDRCSVQLLAYLLSSWRDGETFPVNAPGLADTDALGLTLYAVKKGKKALSHYGYIEQVRDYIRPMPGKPGRAAHWRFTSKATGVHP